MSVVDLHIGELGQPADPAMGRLHFEDVGKPNPHFEDVARDLGFVYNCICPQNRVFHNLAGLAGYPQSGCLHEARSEGC